jgi:thiol:disulfide interchange protein DsbG
MNRVLRTLGATLAMTCGMASLAHADVASVLTAASHGNLHVAKTFKGPAPNIEGLILEGGNRKMLAWGVDNQYVFAGTLYGANGQNLTVKALIDQGLMPRPEGANLISMQGMAAKGFVLGKAGPTILSFEDPNCIFCHKFSDDTRAAIAAGKLRVKVIPVGFLKPDSMGKAVAILQAADPVKAWEANQATFNVKTEEGGIAPVKVNPQSAEVASLKANYTLLARSGTVATPTVVACEKGSATPVVYHGLTPQDLTKLLTVSTPMAQNGTCPQ